MSLFRSVRTSEMNSSVLRSGEERVGQRNSTRSCFSTQHVFDIRIGVAYFDFQSVCPRGDSSEREWGGQETATNEPINTRKIVSSLNHPFYFFYSRLCWSWVARKKFRRCKEEGVSTSESDVVALLPTHQITLLHFS